MVKAPAGTVQLDMGKLSCNSQETHIHYSTYLMLEWELLDKLRDATVGIGGCIVEQSVVAALLNPGA